MALTPSGAMLECAARPLISTCQRTGPLCASTTLIDGRLADQHHARLDEAAAELGDHRAHAEAADLLVVGEGEVDRHRQLALLVVGHGGEHAGEEALHVGGAAAVELAVALGDVNGSEVQRWPSTGTTSVWPESATPATPVGPTVA